jgi:hypothetical protein
LHDVSADDDDEDDDDIEADRNFLGLKAYPTRQLADFVEEYDIIQFETTDSVS